MAAPALLAPSASAVALRAPQPPPAPFEEEAGPGYLARYWAEVASRPVRLLAALMATAVAPVLVIQGSVIARGTAEMAEPAAVTPPAPQETTPVVPVAGDLESWRAGARAAAATCPGLPSEVLVAIGRVESGLGIRTDASYAGALGPMQFLPGTWAAYGADGDGDGRADVMNVLDALHGAARLLCANGGGEPHRLQSAVWNYNRSFSYVERVTVLAGLNPWPAAD